MQYADKSAAEIHGLWTFNWKHDIFKGKYPVRQYYIRVRQAMYRELRETGSCGLIEMYLHADRMSAVLCHAMFDALKAVRDNSALSPVDKEWLDGYGICYSWQELSMSVNDRIVQSDHTQMRGFYLNVAKDFRMKAGRTGQPTLPEENMPPQEDPAALLEEARNQRNSILNDANARHSSILNDANLQRSAILNDANLQRSSIIAAAERTAAQTLADAQVEADRIRQEAEKQAQSEARNLLSCQLGRYMNEQRSLWEQDRQALDAARADMSDAVPALKEEICSVTTSAGAQMNRTVDAMIEQLNDLKSGLLIELNQWRAGLYKCEYGPLINFYSNLVTVAAQFERDVIAEQTGYLTAEQELTALQRHSARMNTLRSNLTRAMEAMGLRTFTPQPGDVFDSYLHATNDAEDDDLYNDRIIARCISPGIERVVNSQVTDVLHRATVQLRSEA